MEIKELEEPITLEKNKKHNIEVVVDRVIVKPGVENRLADSLEAALALADGVVFVNVGSEEKDLVFSEKFACVDCGISVEEITPRTFSFNSPFGACPQCSGLGFKLEIDPGLVVPNPALSLEDGAIEPWSSSSSNYYPQLLESVAKNYGFSLGTPFKDLPKDVQDIVLYGTQGERIKFRYKDRSGNVRYYEVPYEGVIPNLERRYREAQSEWVKSDVEEYMSVSPCPGCKGSRLRPEALAVLSVGKILTRSLS